MSFAIEAALKDNDRTQEKEEHKEVPDLISGESSYSFSTLLIIAGGAFALWLLAWLLDSVFLPEFRAKAMRQYRKYAFDRLLEKGIQAFSGENSARYLSALSNDANSIEQDYTRVIVTHNLDENVLRRCMGLFTLKNGVVSEQGSFDELMERKGYFYSLFTVSQR